MGVEKETAMTDPLTLLVLVALVALICVLTFSE